MQTIRVDNLYAAVENAQRLVSEHMVTEFTWIPNSGSHYHENVGSVLKFPHRLELDGSDDLPEGVLANAHCYVWGLSDTDRWDATQRCGFEVRIYDRRVDDDDVLVVSGSIHDNPDDIMDRLRHA